MVGGKIKTIRESKNITINEMAERSGLSVQQIITIEEDKIIPSLSPLIKISRVLGERIGTFLDDNANIGPVVNKLSDSDKEKSFTSMSCNNNSRLDFFSLANKKAGRNMEPFLIDITPNEGATDMLSSHEGEEFIYVLSGSIEVKYGKETYVLEAGESIYYDSIVDHLVSAANNEPAKILAVVYAPF